MAEGGLREVEALNPRWVDFNALDQSANEEVLRGSKVMAAGELDGAMDCSEREIAWREKLPRLLLPRSAWCLAAALTSHGDVLRNPSGPLEALELAGLFGWIDGAGKGECG